MLSRSFSESGCCLNGLCIRTPRPMCFQSLGRGRPVQSSVSCPGSCRVLRVAFLPAHCIYPGGFLCLGMFPAGCIWLRRCLSARQLLSGSGHGSEPVLQTVACRFRISMPAVRIRIFAALCAYSICRCSALAPCVHSLAVWMRSPAVFRCLSRIVCRVLLGLLRQTRMFRLCCLCLLLRPVLLGSLWYSCESEPADSYLLC